MTTVERLAAVELRAVAQTFRDVLRTHQVALDRLNVYPVPDGDTGTNMALTLEAVVAEVAALPDGADLVEVSRAIGHGSLMGARGNSGVIMSQVLRALAASASASAAHGGVDGPVLAAGLVAAADAAYAAVVRPVEGTILTVARGAADAAAAVGGSGADRAPSLLAVVEAARTGGREALARTPELLPVLAEAGVVDAGGSGYVLLFDALLHVLDGRPLPDAPEAIDPATFAGTLAGHAEDDLRFEVMYLLEAPDEAIAAFKQACAAIGDSIVVVGGDGLWNCHVHTDDIGAALEAGLDAGRPRQVHVTDLREQVEEVAWVREAAPATPPAASPHAPSPHATVEVGTAVVAVATGAGIHQILHSLGVQQVVGGGQTMNPSTADLLAAVERCPADEVVVLPNNGNIVAVAREVDALSTKTVVVVPTRSVTEGFAALVAYDPSATAKANADAMAAATSGRVDGEITQAVRAAGSEVGPIEVGDWLGVAAGGIRAVAPTVAEAATALLDRLVADVHEIVTVIEGDGSSGDVTEAIEAWLAQHRPDVVVEVHQGGQPLYPYLFGIE